MNPMMSFERYLFMSSMSIWEVNKEYTKSWTVYNSTQEFQNETYTIFVIIIEKIKKTTDSITLLKEFQILLLCNNKLAKKQD